MCLPKCRIAVTATSCTSSPLKHQYLATDGHLSVRVVASERAHNLVITARPPSDCTARTSLYSRRPCRSYQASCTLGPRWMCGAVASSCTHCCVAACPSTMRIFPTCSRRSRAASTTSPATCRQVWACFSGQACTGSIPLGLAGQTGSIVRVGTGTDIFSGSAEAERIVMAEAENAFRAVRAVRENLARAGSAGRQNLVRADQRESCQGRSERISSGQA